MPQPVDPRQAGGYGWTLAAVVATHGPLPVRSVLTLAAGLAEALSAAHAAEVIHGDLNPGTVLLTPDGPRLPGLGSARPAGHGQPRAAMPDFVAPEQVAGREGDPASDIFSLGAVLLYAATGAWMSHFAWHLDQFTGELRPFIERCMAADPARRPTAAEFLTELTSAHPEAVSHVGRLPAAQGGIPASAPTPMPAPFGRPATAPPFPAETVSFGARQKASRPAGRIRRHAGLIVIAALALAVAITGAVYVIHPWPYPVLRPAGLTADERGPSSISLSWSTPASGPLPDKYVILQDGITAGTVPGNVDHFKKDGLAPATAYDFQVVAYRGAAHSPTSLDLRAATQKPPLSEAVFDSDFTVTEKLTSGGSSVTGDKDGDTWSDDWTFSSNCDLGPCVAHLSGGIDGEAFSVVLKADNYGNYTGSVPINDYYYCGNNQTDYIDSTLQVSLMASAASASGTQWQASKLSGGVTWEIGSNASNTCGGGTLAIAISG